ncbi:NUDIX hydrolase [Chloroflexota bacterium]
MARAQCIIHRDNMLLMAKHRMDGEEWWCLPGGGIEYGETPSEAALRELQEECSVKGRIIAEVSHIKYPIESESYTYLIDIEDSEPKIGDDIDLIGQYLVDIAWMRLKDIPERDRAFLWWSGLISIPTFFSEMQQWGDDKSYPNSPRNESV